VLGSASHHNFAIGLNGHIVPIVPQRVHKHGALSIAIKGVVEGACSCEAYSRSTNKANTVGRTHHHQLIVWLHGQCIRSGLGSAAVVKVHHQIAIGTKGAVNGSGAVETGNAEIEIIGAHAYGYLALVRAAIVVVHHVQGFVIAGGCKGCFSQRAPFAIDLPRLGKQSGSGQQQEQSTG